MNNVLGGIDDALCQIARVAHDPLRFCCEAGKEAAYALHENFLFHDVSVLMVNKNLLKVKVPFFALWTADYGG